MISSQMQQYEQNPKTKEGDHQEVTLDSQEEDLLISNLCDYVLEFINFKMILKSKNVLPLHKFVVT